MGPGRLRPLASPARGGRPGLHRRHFVDHPGHLAHRGAEDPLAVVGSHAVRLRRSPMRTLAAPHPAWPDTVELDFGRINADPDAALRVVAELAGRAQRLRLPEPFAFGESPHPPATKGGFPAGPPGGVGFG